jgi:flavin reductase (DIM6/NTAB) family NADH-FMN oxidoreductase RutF
MSPGEIHDEHPFSDPLDRRDPVRQFRGRLVAPVTIVTAGGPGEWAGLTVSSLMVAEGEPSSVHLLVGTATDLWLGIEETGRFIVHILEEEHQALSDRFAGFRPSPGGTFAGLDVADTDFGPQITSLQSRARCTYVGHRQDPYHALVHGTIEHIDLHDLERPLRYFRGEYSGG